MKSIEQLKQEYEDYSYLASTLTYDHQATTRLSLIRKANDIKEEIKQREKLLAQQLKESKQISRYI